MNIKKIYFSLLAFAATVAQAQFVSVDWAGSRGDSILPECTAVVELPSDYASYSYSAHIEYPDLRKMTAAEIARYGIAERYGTLPEMPLVECYVGVQAKVPQLDMAFLPVVERGGDYYCIDSYKLVVDRTPLPRRAASARNVAERYAASSVLSAGKWVRIAVEDNGVHKITHAELRRMGFSNPEKVRLYGYGGHILPETGLASLPDDLCEVPLWRESDYMLFYANGTVKWEYLSGRYAHTQNVYSRYGCYFLTEGDAEPLAFPKENVTATPSLEITTFPAYALYEKDEKSLCSYGRVLVEGYDYSQGRSVSYKLPAANVAGGEGVVDLSFATNGVAMSRVAVALNNESLGSLSVGRCVSSEVGKIAEGRFSVSSSLADNPVVKLTHTTSDNSVNGFLDYIRLNYTATLSLAGSQTSFRGNASGGFATYRIAGCNANTRVWDVSNVLEIKELQGSLAGDVLSVVASARRNTELVAVNVKGTFPQVKVMGEVQNQNLHAIEQADMVIIVPSSGKFLPAAERLAEAHRSMDNLSVVVLTAQQIYNEFSSGTPDVTAYRRFMKMLYDRATGVDDAPKYLLLFGDGWYDNRLLTFPGRNQDDYLLCYESLNSVDAVRSYVLEDYMGFLDDNEGANHVRDKVDIGVGRIPAQSVIEANAVVDKTIAYMRNENAGPWQNVVALLGDDGDVNMPNQHMKDADSIAFVMERNFPSYIVDRIYWDDYPMEVSASGNRYPLVTQAIYDRLNEGALIVNYSGHGSANLLAHEMTWKASDMAALDSPRLPFWVTASCDIGPFDMGDNSVAEAAILNPQGGAVGLFTTTRTVMQSYNSIINKEFSKIVLESVNSGERVAVGDASRRAKCNVVLRGSDLSENKLQYVILGDPAVALKTPEYKFVIEQFNGVGAETLSSVSAGSILEIEGRVVNRGGELANDFTGVIYPTLFDCAQVVTTRDNTGLGAYTYTAYDKKLFAGSDSIVNGRFSIRIPIPMDISYSDAQGMLNLFAVDSSFTYSAQGSYNNFVIGGTAQDYVNDAKGPEIKIYLNTPSFVDGDEVNSTPCLLVELFDENGINTVGTGVGHDIMAIVDNSPAHTYNLNSLYTPVIGDYTRGTIALPLSPLEPGEHTLMLRAWDLFNNSSVAAISFFVEPTLAPEFVSVKVNPSPVVVGGSSEFIIEHNRPQSELEVTIDIFNFQGQILWSNTQTAVCDGLEYRYMWNGTVNDGKPLPTGVYLARVYIATGGAVSSSKTIKIVVINNK
ncbi:MAG: type IX secretion system sortase PorU [Bacteroidales bacterium]|nr:type IX secretion system sortase PorU [Bacteroidales bacterium]